MQRCQLVMRHHIYPWPWAETSTPSISDVTLGMTEFLRDFCGIHPSSDLSKDQAAAIRCTEACHGRWRCSFRKRPFRWNLGDGQKVARVADLQTVTTKTTPTTTTTTTTAVAHVFPSMILVRSHVVFWYLFGEVAEPSMQACMLSQLS